MEKDLSVEVNKRGKYLNLFASEKGSNHIEVLTITFNDLYKLMNTAIELNSLKDEIDCLTDEIDMIKGCNKHLKAIIKRTEEQNQYLRAENEELSGKLKALYLIKGGEK